MEHLRRVQLSRRKGWRIPANTIIVSRPGPWGNPFVVGTHGTRAECVDLFRKLLGGYVCITRGVAPGIQEMYLKHATASIRKLRGKHLACWCPLSAPCHADVLLAIANMENES